MVSAKDRVKYLVQKHPEIKWCFSQSKLYGVNEFKFKTLISEEPDLWRWYVLYHVAKNPKLTVKEIGMYEVLEIAMGKSEEYPSLTSIKADILVIHDGTYKSMAHEQKEVFLQVLIDNSPIVIYDWQGSFHDFKVRSRLPEKYHPDYKEKKEVKEELF